MSDYEYYWEKTVKSKKNQILVSVKSKLKKLEHQIDAPAFKDMILYLDSYFDSLVANLKDKYKCEFEGNLSNICDWIENDCFFNCFNVYWKKNPTWISSYLNNVLEHYLPDTFDYKFGGSSELLKNYLYYAIESDNKIKLFYDLYVNQISSDVLFPYTIWEIDDLKEIVYSHLYDYVYMHHDYVSEEKLKYVLKTSFLICEKNLHLCYRPIEDEIPYKSLILQFLKDYSVDLYESEHAKISMKTCESEHTDFWTSFSNQKQHDLNITEETFIEGIIDKWDEINSDSDSDGDEEVGHGFAPGPGENEDDDDDPDDDDGMSDRECDDDDIDDPDDEFDESNNLNTILENIQEEYSIEELSNVFVAAK